jgi:hypothetical protein
VKWKSQFTRLLKGPSRFYNLCGNIFPPTPSSSFSDHPHKPSSNTTCSGFFDIFVLRRATSPSRCKVRAALAHHNNPKNLIQTDAKCAGCFVSWPLCLLLVLCCFSGLISAGPVNRRDVAHATDSTDDLTPAVPPRTSPFSPSQPESETGTSLELTSRNANFNWALNCADNRDDTLKCLRRGYLCTAFGKLAYQHTYNYFCAEVCKCVNLAPAPKIVPVPVLCPEANIICATADVVNITSPYEQPELQTNGRCFPP